MFALVNFCQFFAFFFNFVLDRTQRIDFFAQISDCLIARHEGEPAAEAKCDDRNDKS